MKLAVLLIALAFPAVAPAAATPVDVTFTGTASGR
jgi:hypothetical protein